MNHHMRTNLFIYPAFYRHFFSLNFVFGSFVFYSAFHFIMIIVNFFHILSSLGSFHAASRDTRRYSRDM